MIRKAIALILITSLTACNLMSRPSPVTEQAEGNLFKNEYFRLTVEKPEGWYAQSARETILSQHKGKRILAAGDKEMEVVIEKSIETTLPLFGFFEFRHGSQDSLNPSVLAVAQNMKNFPSAKTACDYLEHVKTVLSKGQIPYIFENNCKKTTQGGKELSMLNAYAKVGNNYVYQRYYATLQGKHAISIIETFFDDATEAKVEQVLRSIRFDVK